MKTQIWKDSLGTIYIAELFENNVQWYKEDKPKIKRVDSKATFNRRSKYWELIG
jgi:hypothetical protein